MPEQSHTDEKFDIGGFMKKSFWVNIAGAVLGILAGGTEHALKQHGINIPPDSEYYLAIFGFAYLHYYKFDSMPKPEDYVYRVLASWVYSVGPILTGAVLHSLVSSS